MNDWIKLLFWPTQRFGEIDFMNMLGLQRYGALVPVGFSIGLLIYCLATSTKVPIRVTVIAPYLEITVEINLDQSPSRFDSLQDVAEIFIASDEEDKTVSDVSELN